MTKCQKCGGDLIGGPYYCRGGHWCDHAKVFSEHLTYTCLRCGYQEHAPCRDAERKVEETKEEAP